MGKDLKGKEIGRGFGQRSDGRYEARISVNGRKICLYGMKLPELKRRFEQEKAKLLRDEKGIRPNLKLSDWFDEWFEKCKSPNLKSDVSRKVYYRKCSNTFIAELGYKKVEEITQFDVQTAASTLVEKQYSSRGVKEGLGILKECLDVAAINSIIHANPCVCINVREDNVQTERRVLSKEEQKLFLEETEGSYYYEAYKILLLTGMRIGEFSGLRWQDIDFEKKVINIRHSMQAAYFDGRKVLELTTPKTHNAYRAIPFFDETESCLREWKKKQEAYREKMGRRWRLSPEYSDLVFTTTMGSPVTRYVLAHDIQRVEQNINLKEITNAHIEGREPKEFAHVHPHAFRHTFATRCFEKGLSPHFVQSIMGHANYSTTISYTHVLDEMRQEEVQKAGRFLE